METYPQGPNKLESFCGGKKNKKSIRKTKKKNGFQPLNRFFNKTIHASMRKQTRTY